MSELKYIGYVRKSTEDEEKQVLSKGAQKDKIFERFGELNIVDVLEESKSAFEPDKRPVFKQILEMIDSGEVDGIIAWHPDRLSRNEVDASSITWRIRQNIIKDLKFANFSFDNSPEGMMMLQMTMSQSQYFSAKLSKDVKRGNEKKRKIGGLTGMAPQGWINERANKTVIVDPERFPLLRKAVDLLLTGEYSVPQVLEILNNEWGYRTIKRRKSGGDRLSRAGFYSWLRNPRIAGQIPEPNDPEVLYDADYKAIMSVDEFNRIQSILGARGCPRLASKKEFDLRGLIRCGECGCMITAESKKKVLKDGTTRHHTYYHCTGKRVGCSQKGVYITERELYQQVNELLDQYELAPELEEWAMDALRDLAAQESIERDSVQAMQTKSIKDTQQQLDRLLDMATRNMISDAEFNNKSLLLKKELKALQEQQADTAYRVKNWYDFVCETFSKLTNAQEKFAKSSLSVRKDILLAIGQNPVLVDKNLSITPNVWLNPVASRVQSLREQLEKVRTVPKQMRKASEEAVRLQWYPGRDSNPQPSG